MFTAMSTNSTNFATLTKTMRDNLTTARLNFNKYNHFQVAAPRLWDSLIDDIRSIQNLDVFKNKIKTLLFREVFIS